MTDARPRFPLGLTISTLIALAILVTLGCWQLQRRVWKEDMLAHIAALKDAPAVDLAAVLARAKAGENVEYTRVTVTCPGLASAPFQEIYALSDGAMASRLVSACPLQGAPYDGVLVDRGFIYANVATRPPVSTDAAPVAVTGVLRLGDKKPGKLGAAVQGQTDQPAPERKVWYGRDLIAIATTLGLKAPAPYFLMAETETNPAFPALKPAGLPTDIPNRHLEYALTWFGLAAALVGVYAALLRRKMKGR